MGDVLYQQLPHFHVNKHRDGGTDRLRIVRGLELNIRHKISHVLLVHPH